MEIQNVSTLFSVKVKKTKKYSCSYAAYMQMNLYINLLRILFAYEVFFIVTMSALGAFKKICQNAKITLVK